MTTRPPTTIHERIAAALNWSIKDVQSFSLITLRDLVRPLNAKLASEMDEIIRSGRVILPAEKFG